MRIIVYFLIASIIISCGPSVPKDVLPPEKIKLVLWDIMQADELAEHRSISDSSFTSLAKHVDYYQSVLTIHKISKEQFTNSINYYTNHPEVFKIVLDSLQSFGERMQNPPAKSSGKKRDSSLKTPDSLRKKRPVSQER